MNTLLFEIGVEDIPSIYITDSVLSELKETALKQFQQKNINIEKENIALCATNRRLVYKININQDKTQDMIEQVSGPAKDAAYDKDNKPTKALQGFLRSKGADISQLKQMDKAGRLYVYFERNIPGKCVEELLPEILPEIISQIKFPKTMKWDGSDKNFVRPIRWILALYNDKVINFEYAGLKTDKYTFGHRLYANKKIEIKASADYENTLEKNFVMVNQQKRFEKISQEIKDISDNKVLAEESLINSLTYLTEWPTAIKGKFDKAYLSLPKEVLKESLAKHQKIFSAADEKGSILPEFVGVLNSGKDNIDVIRKNYENILYARLSDAQFFYNEDTKTRLEEKKGQLKAIMFLKNLGTVDDRQYRMQQLATNVIKDMVQLKEQEWIHLMKAATLCKVDLVTNMVREFPSLQGVIGKYYALHDNEPVKVAQAVEDHYRPRFAGDELPGTKAGSILAILDKMDIIVGCFALGLLPSGNADPYALRRAMRGIIQIILDKQLDIDIYKLYAKNNELLGGKKAKSGNLFVEFFKERLRLFFVQDKKYEYDLVEAVLCVGTGSVLDTADRLRILSDLRKSDEQVFLNARKIIERTSNILKNIDTAKLPDKIDRNLFEHNLEREIFKNLQDCAENIKSLVKTKKYEEATRQYAEVFFEVIDKFFDEVLVNVENKSIRNNRLRLMNEINVLYTEKVADLSKVVIT